MKAFLFSKLTLFFGLAVACALSVHFAPSQRLQVHPAAAVPQATEALRLNEPVVSEMIQPRVIEVRQDPQAEFATATVQVPPGVRQVTLQSLESAEGWITRAIASVDGSGENLTLPVPAGVQVRNLRALSEVNEPSDVNGASSPAPDVRTPLPSASDAQTRFALLSAARPAAPRTSPGLFTTQTGDTNNTARTVTESDIWKIRGNTLYFFNQLRGLQIIDITNPDAPVRGGKLSLPAVGEDMYILDDTHVILLARKGSRWDQSEVIAVTITDGAPAITARFDINGMINTSRLVGAALYVATNWYQSVNVTATYGTLLAAFDFSIPGAPVVRNTLWFDGWGSEAVTATDRFFFITAFARNGTGSSSLIHVVDISSADGNMIAQGTIAPTGTVADKFKIGLHGDVCTVISQIGDWTTQTLSILETFSLADPNTPVKLGEVGVGAGEQLFATRIEGTRAYIVTALQIDPLWIIDLTDPAHPTVTGELEVPGFSTFIQPLGDRLVTIGIVNNQIAISLFDVHNPAAPALLSRVAAGGTNSWSEAVWNEKAFSVLPDAGLILVPSSGWNSESGFAAQVQLIDLGATFLTLRGVIDQPFEPRRATLFADRILSISNRELLTVDAADRDHPGVISDLALAWAVDRVFVQGDYLLEMENGNAWSNGAPTLRVALASDPDQVQSATHLGAAPVLGAVSRGGRLYLAQADVNNTGTGEAQSTLTFSIYDLAQLPQVVLLGQTQTEVDPLYVSGLDALWPKPGVLVWTPSGSNWLGGFPPIMQTDVALWWGGGGAEARLFAFDTTVPGAPAFLSETTFAADAWSTGDAFAGDAAIYSSHLGDVEINEPGFQGWAHGWFLDVIDFTNPATPVLRAPVSIPTTLVGVQNATAQSATLFTLGAHVQDENNSGPSLDASAYDGVSATLLDSASLTGWSNPAVVDGATIFVGRPTGDSSGAIESWRLSGNNHLALLGSVSVAGVPRNLRTIGALLTVQTDGQILLFEKSDASSLLQIGAGETDSYYAGWSVDGAAGDLTRGLWLPLGDYGVLPIAVTEGN